MGCGIFQPTRPLRGATVWIWVEIAIHGFQPTRPLRGATAAVMASTVPPVDFNPRAPCGARRYVGYQQLSKLAISTHAPLAGRDYVSDFPTMVSQSFQPTRPLRGATCIDGLPFTSVKKFQPTRPLRGATRRNAARNSGRDDFNPRAPCGARQGR